MLIAATGYALIASLIGWAIVFGLGEVLLEKAERTRLAVIWFVITIMLFVVPSGLLFLFSLAILLLVLGATEGVDRTALGVFVMFTSPASGLAIEGLPGGINYLLTFTVSLLTAMVVFMPAAFSAPKVGSLQPDGRRLPRQRRLGAVDGGVFILFALLCALDARGANFTSTLRLIVTWTFTLLVPYLAFSRAVVSAKSLDQVLRYFLVGVLVSGAVALFISLLGWQVYDIPEGRLFGDRPAALVWRLGMMRSGGPLAGSPISFGTICVVGCAVAIAFATKMSTQWKRWLIIAVPVLAVLATVSRGPMVGLLLVAIAYQFTRPNPLRALGKTSILGLAGSVPLVLFTSFGRSLLNLFPGLGEETSQQGSIDYREELLRIGLRVAAKNPFFGRKDYEADPEMQELVQGQGIIDIVNTYLQYALSYGYFTLFVYMSILFGVMASVFFTSRKITPELPSRLREIGGALFAGLAAFSVIIFTTTSTTGLLPSFTWILIGVSVAYVRLAHAHIAETTIAAIAPDTEEILASDSGPALAGGSGVVVAHDAAERSASATPTNEPTSQGGSATNPSTLPRQAPPSLPPGPRW